MGHVALTEALCRDFWMEWDPSYHNEACQYSYRSEYLVYQSCSALIRAHTRVSSVFSDLSEDP